MSENRKSAAGRSRKPAADTAKVPARTLPRPVDNVRAVASDYPFALLLGGMALGVVVGAMLPRAAGRKLARGAVAAATLAGELGLIYGRQALDKAGETAGSLDGLKAAVATTAADYSRRAADVTEDALTAARTSAREVGHKIGRQAIRLRSQLRH